MKKLSEGGRKKAIILSGLLLVVVAVLGLFLYLFSQNKIPNPLSKSSTSESEVNALVASVGKLIELPQGEVPTVATVSDTTKLTEQPFFQNAQNGDKVLIYSNAKKAILFRPSTGKLVEVAPLNLGSTETAVTPTVAPIVKIALFNGTKINGLTTKIEARLKEKVSEGIEAVVKTNAAEDYEKTLVVDLVGSQKALAEQIAKELGGEVGKIPAGEEKPQGVDILVILGGDNF